MKRLWAPWRIHYLEAPKPQFVTGCVFCEKIAQDADRDNLLLWRGESACIVMNLYPYNSGHLMVIPYCHVSRIAQVSPETIAEMWSLVNRCVAALERTIRPEGFNIGINMGKAAGAGVDEHLHLHVVPRWSGDTNFMTVLDDTRVVPETLLSTYDKLKAALGEV
jgi:ATP adenylyltransferase